jgi:hypothetical protein
MNEIKLDIFGEIAAAIRPQEITEEQEYTFKSLAKDYLEDPAGFVNELFDNHSEDVIATALDDNYPGIELARGLIQLWNETVELQKKVKAADKQFDEMRRMIFDFQTNK